MKKLLSAFAGILAVLACGPQVPVSIVSVAISPPGDTTSVTLTAKIEAGGQGKIRVEWLNARYDSVSTAKTQEIAVDTEGVYESDLSSGLGWYWVDVFDEKDSLLWHTDSVFCGPDSSLPKIDFSVDADSGSKPLVVTFTNNTSKDAYTRWLWGFGDGGTSEEWEPVHSYDDAGTFWAKLTVHTLAGSSSDSVSIKVIEPLAVNSVEITPPGSPSKTTLTASIHAGGQGKIKVEWLNACYDSVSTAKTQEIVVDTEGVYESTLASDLGWYWVDVLDEKNSLLWHTDSVFCGPDTSLPVPAFSPDWSYGPRPLTVTFFIEADSNAYTKAYWDFADGATSTAWEPVHTYEDAGQFYVILVLRNLAGSAKDSTLIMVW